MHSTTSAAIVDIGDKQFALNPITLSPSGNNPNPDVALYNSHFASPLSPPPWQVLIVDLAKSTKDLFYPSIDNSLCQREYFYLPDLVRRWNTGR